MKVMVQVTGPERSGDVRVQVLKYDVRYNRKLEVAHWQLLPGQGELIHSSGAASRESHLDANEPRKG